MSSERSLETINKLKIDNYSDAALARIDEWRCARAQGELYVACACSDARMNLPEMAYHIRTISATGPRSFWHNVFNYEKIKGIAIFDHFSCGGLGVKADIARSPEDGSEIEAKAYVRDHVWHTDPVIQSILTASWTASRTHKAVLAAVQDHHNGKLYIQGVFYNNDQTEHKTVPTYQLMSDYIHEDIYKNGRPELRDHLIPPLFWPMLEEVEAKSAALLEKYPDFVERQTVQNPEFVVLSTITKPLSIRFPGMFKEPGTAFQVTLRRPDSVTDSELNSVYVSEAWKQVNYPLHHCVAVQNLLSGAFKDSRVLYIETGKMEDSAKLAQQAIKKSWVIEWLELPQREIVIAEVIAGRIRNIDRVA